MNGNNTYFYDPTEEERRILEEQEMELELEYEEQQERLYAEKLGIDWEIYLRWKSPEPKYSGAEGDDLPF